MSADYTIASSSGSIVVVLNEAISEKDVKEMLTFNPEDVEYLLRTHSGVQSYWEALSIRLMSRYDNFVDVFLKKWWAHSNNHARTVLAAYGDAKPTAAAVQDMAVQIYSEDATDLERKKYATHAYEYVSKRSSSMSFDEYYAVMFRYQLLTPPWYFESVCNTVTKMKEDADLVKSIASKLNDKAFSLSTYAKSFMSKFGNVGPLSVNEATAMQVTSSYGKNPR